MRFLAIENVSRPSGPKIAQSLLQEEARAVWELEKRELIREIWFTRGDCRAVILLECADQTEAERHLAQLPLVREGVIAFEVLALKPYDGLDRLL